MRTRGRGGCCRVRSCGGGRCVLGGGGRCVGGMGSRTCVGISLIEVKRKDEEDVQVVHGDVQ